MSCRARTADRTRPAPRAGRCARGFSLTELMITLAIISILASIALPSYRNYVMRAHRGDATQALLRIAAQQEKYYIQNNSYAATLDADGLDMDAKSENGWYDLSVTAGDVNGFTAEAVVDSGEAQADDEDCQTFSIDSEGRKLAFDAGGTANEDVCWR
jgi:type IV pilus assembly protein PilE